MREKDLIDPKTGKQMTPAELKDKFALPNAPEHISDVSLPPGPRVRVGIANPHPTWGRGNGVQFEVLDGVDPDWFILRGKI